MTRTIQQITNEAYDDLTALGAAHQIAITYFKAIAQLASPGDVVTELAKLGQQHCDEFHAHAQAWADRLGAAVDAWETDAPQSPGLPDRGASAGGGQ